MGPVLGLREAGTDAWSLTAVVTAEHKPGKLTIGSGADGKEFLPEPLWSRNGWTAYRYSFDVPLSKKPSSFCYSVAGKSYVVALPAAGEAPCMAYASCNGFSSAKVMKGVKDKNAMWRRMAEQHAKRPYHLLLLGGDQVYADSMWETVSELRLWAGMSYNAGNKAKASKVMVDAVADFFFALYAERWSQAEIADMLSRVPMIAMWDDHDLMDGWGSYPSERQDCDVLQKAIWPAAERAFRTFQQHLANGETHPSGLGKGSAYSRGHVIGDIALLALDMRSERTTQQVLSAAHWRAVFKWMEKLKDVRHLLVMSSIPIVYPGFDTLERLLGVLPGHQDLEDDLRDHWNSRPHKGERLRLIHRLLQTAQAQVIRPTILSGDVHVAALGVVESGRGGSGRVAVVNQLISSGVVHPGPGGAALFVLRHLFDSTDEMDQGIAARMVEFPGTQERFIGRRNYLSLEPDLEPLPGRIWSNWFVEGEDEPYTKVIHPLERVADDDGIRTNDAVSPRA